MSSDVTKRFSGRVNDYIKYRPGYPEEILDFLMKNCGLNKSSVIADIGSGTGKSAEIFLENGNRVIAVEPNAEMREAAEKMHTGFPNFISIDGRAEATGLMNNTIDFVVAGQAFHWFNSKEAKAEFLRIMKPGSFVILVWNEREKGGTGFMEDYDQFLLNNSIDYQEIDHRNVDENILDDFYYPGSCSLERFEYKQVFDFTGLKGRYDSCSYAYPNDDTRYENTISGLRRLFENYQQHGKVEMKYATKMYWGKMQH